MEHQLQGSGTSISINSIKSGYAATMFTYYSYYFFYCSSTVEIWCGTLSFFFLKFRTVATVSGGTVATVVTFFFSVFRMYYIYIYCYIDTTNFTIFLPLLKCQFLLSQNKIIKYETVTNHN